jgi:hypothetical protein
VGPTYQSLYHWVLCCPADSLFKAPHRPDSAGLKPHAPPPLYERATPPCPAFDGKSAAPPHFFCCRSPHCCRCLHGADRLCLTSFFTARRSVSHRLVAAAAIELTRRGSQPPPVCAYPGCSHCRHRPLRSSPVRSRRLPSARLDGHRLAAAPCRHAACAAPRAPALDAA